MKKLLRISFVAWVLSVQCVSQASADTTVARDAPVTVSSTVTNVLVPSFANGKVVGFQVYGSQVATNTVTVSQLITPSGQTAVVLTNAVATITVTAGAGSAAITNGYIVPGDYFQYTSSSTGTCFVLPTREVWYP